MMKKKKKKKGEKRFLFIALISPKLRSYALVSAFLLVNISQSVPLKVVPSHVVGHTHNSVTDERKKKK